MYVLVEVHQGGDVRGNYGAWRIYKLEEGWGNSPAECGFIDWVVGWSVSDTAGEPIEHLNDSLGIGYSSSPTCEAEDILDGSIQWSDADGGFLVEYDGDTVVIHPYTSAEYR